MAGCEGWVAGARRRKRKGREGEKVEGEGGSEGRGGGGRERRQRRGGEERPPVFVSGRVSFLPSCDPLLLGGVCERVFPGPPSSRHRVCVYSYKGASECAVESAETIALIIKQLIF